MLLGAVTVTTEELSLYLSQEGGLYQQSLVVGTSGEGNLSEVGLESNLTTRMEPGGFGIYTVTLLNPGDSSFASLRLYFFLDLAIDQAENGFFNEYGFRVPEESNTSLITWQIDEPDYLGGHIVEKLESAALDQTAHITMQQPDDVSMALGLDIAEIPAKSYMAFDLVLSRHNIGGLAQTDPDSNATVYVNAVVSGSGELTLNPPVAYDDNATADVGTNASVAILVNDTDPEGDIDPATVDLLSIGAEDSDGDGDHDILSVTGEGTWHVDAAGVLSFVPTEGFTADPTPILYTVSDAGGLISNTAAVTIDYLQHPPHAVDDNVTAEATGEVTAVEVTLNDSDVDGDIDSESVEIVHAGATDSDGDDLADTLQIEGEGIWNVESGALLFTPAEGFTGDPSPVHYRVSDRTGLVSGTAEVRIDYPQTAPIAVDDTVNAATHTAVTVDVLSNDTDGENDIDPASVGIVMAGAVDSDSDGDNDTLTVSGEGEWRVGETGILTFTPEALFVQDPTPIAYTVSDRTGLMSGVATVTIDYLQVAPVARDDNATAAGTGVTVIVDVLSNDSDADGDMNVSSVRIDAASAVDSDGDRDTLDVTGQGIWSVDNTTGTISFMPQGGFTGDPTPIAYRVGDSMGLLSNAAFVGIDYPQTPPQTSDDYATGQTHETVTVIVLLNDSDAQNDIMFTAVRLDDARAVDSDGDGDRDFLAVPDEGNWSVENATGAVTFMPQSDFAGDPVPVGYRVADRTGLLSDAAMITIDYLQSAPVALDDNVSAATGTAIVIDVLANDSDADGDLDPETLAIVNTTATDENGDGYNDTLVVAEEGIWRVSNGMISFTPTDGFTGDPAPLHYRVSDRTGLMSQTGTVMVDYPQTAPVAVNDIAKNVPARTVAMVAVLANDRDSEGDIDPSTVSIVTAGAIDSDGDGDFDTLAVMHEGVWHADNNGTVTFTPETAFIADPTVIAYRVSDRTGLVSGTATVKIDYLQHAPTVQDDNVSAATGAIATVDVLRNDSDADGDLNASTVDIFEASAVDSDGDGDRDRFESAGQGTWSVDNGSGRVTFVPVAGFTADPAPLRYRVADSMGLYSDMASIRIDYPQTVPVAQDDSVTAQTGVSAVVQVLANDRDAENDINASSVGFIDPDAVDTDHDGDRDRLNVASEGVWSIGEPSGTVTFIPATGFTGDPVPVAYRVADRTGLLSEAALIRVDYPQTAPIVVDDFAAGATHATITVAVLSNDSDAENDINSSTVALVAAQAVDSDGDGDGDLLEVPMEGSWSVDDATGIITFTPLPDFTSDPSAVTYRVSDRTGLTSETARIVIDYLQTAPFAVDDNASAVSGATVVINVLANDGDGDADLDASTISILNAGATDGNGDGFNDTLIVAGEGSWSVESAAVKFVPARGFIGDPAPLTYRIYDHTGLASQTAMVRIDYPQTPPVAADDLATAPTHATVVIDLLSNDSDAEGDINASSVHLTASSAVDSDGDGDADSYAAPNEGKWTVDNVTGVMTFTPLADFTADPTPVHYRVSDSFALVSNNAAVHIDYLQIAPIAVDDNATVGARETITIDLIANDSDADGDLDLSTVSLLHAAAYDSDGDGDNDTLEIAGEGDWHVNESGILTFTAERSLRDDPTAIGYRVMDRTGLASNRASIDLIYAYYGLDTRCSHHLGLNVFDAAGAIRLGSCQTELHRHGDTLLNVSENKLFVQGNCYSHCDGNRCEGSGVFAQRLELPPFEGGVKSTGSQTIKNEGDEIVAGRNKITVQTNGRFDVAVDNTLMHEIYSLTIRNNSDFRFNYSGDVPYKIKTLKLQSGNAHTITFEPGTYFIEKFTHQAGTNLAVDGTGDGSGTVRLYVKNGIKLNGGHSNVNFDDALDSNYDQDAGALLIVSYEGDINIQAGVDIAALIYAEEGDISIKASPLTFSGAATANNITLQNSVTYWEAGNEGECPNE